LDDSPFVANDKLQCFNQANKSHDRDRATFREGAENAPSQWPSSQHCLLRSKARAKSDEVGL
jgi:hypothetical protein